MRPIQRILVPTDCSEMSRRAMAYAVRLAHQCGAEIIVVAVFDVSHLAGVGLSLYGSENVITVSNSEQCMIELDSFAGPFAEAEDAPPVRTVQASGVPHVEIVRVAGDESADLIVMGTARKRGIRAMLLGSVAERVFRRAPCPVLVIPPDEQA